MSKYSYENTDDNYIRSSIGSEFFGGLLFEQLWNCVVLSENRKQLDAAASTTIMINELIKGEKND